MEALNDILNILVGGLVGLITTNSLAQVIALAFISSVVIGEGARIIIFIVVLNSGDKQGKDKNARQNILAYLNYKGVLVSFYFFPYLFYIIEKIIYDRHSNQVFYLFISALGTLVIHYYGIKVIVAYFNKRRD